MRFDRNGLMTMEDGTTIKRDSKGKQRTDAWVGRFHVGCAGDMLELEKIKDTVKSMNKLLSQGEATDKRGRPIRYRLKVKGRKPINKVINPDTGRENGFTHFGEIIGGIANASELDAYIYRR